MNISISKETLFKCLAAAVFPLGLWMVSLRIDLALIKADLESLESNKEKVETLAQKQARLLITVDQIKANTEELKTNHIKVAEVAQSNSGTIREMQVSLRYIEDGIRIIRNRLADPGETHD